MDKETKVENKKESLLKILEDKEVKSYKISLDSNGCIDINIKLEK